MLSLNSRENRGPKKRGGVPGSPCHSVVEQKKIIVIQHFLCMSSVHDKHFVDRLLNPHWSPVPRVLLATHKGRNWSERLHALLQVTQLWQAVEPGVVPGSNRVLSPLMGSAPFLQQQVGRYVTPGVSDG